MILALLCGLYITLDSYGHYFVGKQLSFMQPKVVKDNPEQTKNNKLKAGEFKGAWHTWFLLTRGGVWIAFTIIAYMYFENWWLIAMSNLFLIALGHEVIPNGFRITVTCEDFKGKGYDTDCIVRKLYDNYGINTNVVLLVLWALTLIVYLISLIDLAEFLIYYIQYGWYIPIR